MAVKPVLTIQDERLYKVSEAVTKFDKGLRDLVRDMFDSMAAEGGVGLAAVQIGILKRVLVIDLVEKGFIKGAFINPRLLEASKEMQDGEEGCLSVPGLSAELKRPKWVKIGYQDMSGNEKVVEGEMLLARAFLHEMDHLDGKVFVDQLEPATHKMLAGDVDRIKRGLPAEHPEEPRYRNRKKSA
ncbi:MAG TPA: peptide deformylase [Turneriella sp.]|nr:peptide deformylase [Turneriella sp.]HNA78453.1 peptide deformylase [Turneriella sp.]HNE19703.1 peptide deformylase [Turneriella sp.]HNJ64664.1 peptide deformylase [Turneriella sp.]HNL08895.1 peptide deformylase [Turneriella sp.]